MSKVTINCPCCEYDLSVSYTPGTPAVHYPNDKAHPGDPPEFWPLEDQCQCGDYLASRGSEYDYYFDLCLERIEEKLEEAGP